MLLGDDVMKPVGPAPMFLGKTECEVHISAVVEFDWQKADFKIKQYTRIGIEVSHEAFSSRYHVYIDRLKSAK